MLFEDTYKTIRSSSQGLYRDKGSRFISFADPVKDTDSVKKRLDILRKQYHDARHHCYAYRIGYDKSIWRTNDDGEPSGSAGKPIMGQIISHDLTNVLIVVIRYFGGTLLGIPGLINAYRSAASDAISNSGITECIVRDYYTLHFPYEAMNDVMKVIKEESVLQSDQSFGLDCSIRIGFRLSMKDHIFDRFSSIDKVELKFIERQ